MMRRGFGFRNRVGDGHSQAGLFEHAHIHYVISDITNLLPVQTGFSQKCVDGLHFATFALHQEIDFQIAGPLSGRRGRPARDPSDADAFALQELEAKAVPDAKSLQLQPAAHPDGSVGQNTVDVAEEQPDALEAGAERSAGRHGEPSIPNTKNIEH
jgi:hypothetical protein